MKRQFKIIMVVLCVCTLIGTVAVGLAGCKKGGDAEKDILVISREDGSGTRDAFDSLIKKDGASLAKDAEGKKYTTSPFVKTVEMLSKTGDVKTKVSVTKTAIGYISLGSLDNTVKALTINGVVANSENVLNGTYLLKRPFVIVTSNSTTLTAATDDFIKYLKSTQAQTIVKAQKYVEQASTTTYAAPATAVTGTIYIKGSTSVDPLMDKLIAGYKTAGGEIDDMLNLSKLENKKELKPVHVNLKEATDEVFGTLSQFASEKNVMLSVYGDGTVYAGREHIFEVIKNLVENGVRYNNDGGKVDVRISMKKDKTILEVEDNGIGIDESNQTRIFERFYRVDKSRSRETAGTGLGLSIVKHAAELYNANVRLQSKIGVGTSVREVFKNAPNTTK